MNWLDTSPGRAKSPPVSRPVTVRGRPEAAERVTPWGGRQSAYTPRGRSGSRPWPVKTAGIPRAAYRGMRKRRVDPLSPQSTGRGEGEEDGGAGAKQAASPSRRTDTPRPRTARRVASMSAERLRPRTRPSPARAAAISSRWAADLEGGGVRVPRMTEGEMTARDMAGLLSLCQPPRKAGSSDRGRR